MLDFVRNMVSDIDTVSKYVNIISIYPGLTDMLCKPMMFSYKENDDANLPENMKAGSRQTVGAVRD